MRKILVFVLILLLLAVGCRKAATEPEPLPATVPEARITASPAASTAEPAAAEPALTPEPQAEATAEPAAYAFTFAASTLDGETVTEEFFGQYDLTMVNVWASWCPPCRGELSELGQLYGRLPKNVGFLSVTVDDPADLKDAKALLLQNDCAFPCLDGQASQGLMNGFLSRVMAIPTTLFLDSRGNEVGQWIVGVPQGDGSVADAYMTEIQARLDQLNGK